MGLIKYLDYEPKHLSYSTISGYRMCGAKFRFEKIFRLEQIPGLAATGGNAVHTATQLWDVLSLEHGLDAMDDLDLSVDDIARMVGEL